MRTVRSSGRLGAGVSAPGEGGSAPGGNCSRGGVCSGGVCPREVSVPGEVSAPGGVYPTMHWGRHPLPPVDRQTPVKT